MEFSYVPALGRNVIATRPPEARWTLGFVDPPLALSARGREFCVAALNARGERLLPAVVETLERLRADGVVAELSAALGAADGAVDAPAAERAEAGAAARVRGRVAAPEGVVLSEEARTRQPSLMSVVRALVDLW